METAKDFLYHRLVTEPDGFHDHDSYVEQMREGYEDQIIEAMESYSEQKLNIAIVSGSAQHVVRKLNHVFTEESRKHIGKVIKDEPELMKILEAIDVIERHCR